MLKETETLSVVTFSIFDAVPAVTAAVSTRRGGVSTSVFSSLNMSFASGDDPAAVRENRRRFLSALKIDPAQIVCCNQVHGIHVVRAGQADRGRGALVRDGAIPDCDGLMTDEAGVPLTMNFADCTPLLFWDPVHHAVAVAHGGWRGTAGNIGAVVLRQMKDAYGTDPADVLAAVGPAIGSAAFEVGQDVIDAFSPLFSPVEMEELARPTKAGKYVFDLPKANRFLLMQAGICRDHIEDASLCTYTRDDLFFSYRKASRQGQKTGRHMAVIVWNEGSEVHG